jgi:hypothetical protein
MLTLYGIAVLTFLMLMNALDSRVRVRRRRSTGATLTPARANTRAALHPDARADNDYVRIQPTQASRAKRAAA